MGSHGTVVFNTFVIEPASGRDFLRGMRSAFNLSGSTRGDYAFSGTPEEADLAALACDWNAVAADLDGVIAGHVTEPLGHP